MYDPARDVFQPSPAKDEKPKREKAPEKVICGSSGLVVRSIPRSFSNRLQPSEQLDGLGEHNQRRNESSTNMAQATSKKRQRSTSPSLAAETFQQQHGSTSPPTKKRRSSVAPRSPRTEQADSTNPVLNSSAETWSVPAVTEKTVVDIQPVEIRTNGTRKEDRADQLPKAISESRGDRATRINNRNGERHSARDTSRRSPQQGLDLDNKLHREHHSRPRSPARYRPQATSSRSVYNRRDPPAPPRRSRSPSPIRQSPPREDQPSRRPGGGTGRGRNVLAIAQRLAEEREREQEQQNAQIQRERGVQHVSNQFYNSRPEWVKERGRDWRKNESKIKGLRAFNNWIKSYIIQTFSPEEAPQAEELGWGEEPKAPAEREPLRVLDIGCGKGGDLGKWQLAPQKIGLYVGLDPADQSVVQARDRYAGMRRGRKPIFDARFYVKDCFGEWVGDVPILRDVGVDATISNQGASGPSRWGAGGFDVVSMMFSMHYAFESEDKARTMLRNVAGSLKKGGRLIGVVPNSDAISERVVAWWKSHDQGKAAGPEDQTGVTEENQSIVNSMNTADGSASSHHSSATINGFSEQHTNNPSSTSSSSNSAPSWGNTLYTVRFNDPPPRDGIFRNPPFGWKYMYWMCEAVDVPEYVVPWEAFRALAEGFNLEMRYRKPFLDVWEAEVGDYQQIERRKKKRGGDGIGSADDDKQRGEMRRLAVRMGVLKEESGDELCLSDEEREAVRFYHAFCFVKV